MQTYLALSQSPMVQEINRLMDNGRWADAYRLAVQARDATPAGPLRRRYHGLALFAAARLDKPRAKPAQFPA